MTRSVAHRVSVAVLAATTLVAACGDESLAPLDEAESAAVDTLVTADLTLQEQRCILDALVDLDIAPAAVINDTLSPDQDGELLGATLECVDDLSQVEAVVDSFIEGAAQEGTTLSRDEARCAIQALDADDADQAALACLGDRLSAVNDFGDDPTLDLLWTQCDGGNSQACDALYRDAPIGSAYEEFGRTCGDQLPDSAGLLCFEELG